MWMNMGYWNGVMSTSNVAINSDLITRYREFSPLNCLVIKKKLLTRA